MKSNEALKAIQDTIDLEFESVSTDDEVQWVHQVEESWRKVIELYANDVGVKAEEIDIPVVEEAYDHTWTIKTMSDKGAHDDRFWVWLKDGFNHNKIAYEQTRSRGGFLFKPSSTKPPI